jgi:dTDP-4-amino-4,6-dideoxygalactose transaminase
VSHHLLVVIPFSPPRIDQKIIDAVVETLKSGWITTGPKTKLFEKRLAEYCRAQLVLCLNSATSGLELMLRWFGVKEGDEVILPAYTYSGTANVVLHCGAKPVFVDIQDDFNINVQNIEKAITSKTKVIMPVDVGGWPCDYNEINALVQRDDVKKKFFGESLEQKMLGRILVLSDAAHSLGATYNGNRTGTLADITVFSFHAVKNLTTAEGGAVVFNLPSPFDNGKLYRKLCVTSLHGQNKDALAKAQKGSWQYDIVEAGYKMNMTDILASIGLIELERYDNDTLGKRKWICDKYSERLAKYEWAIIPQSEVNSPQTKIKTSSYHLYQLRIKRIDENQRNDIMQKIFDRDVSVNVHFIPVPMMSYYKSLGFDIKDYPKTYEMYSNEISLPVFYDMTEQQIEQVINAVTESVAEVLKQGSA